jgi:hypothetical protein
LKNDAGESVGPDHLFRRGLDPGVFPALQLDPGVEEMEPGTAMCLQAWDAGLADASWVAELNEECPSVLPDLALSSATMLVAFDLALRQYGNRKAKLLEPRRSRPYAW